MIDHLSTVESSSNEILSSFHFFQPKIKIYIETQLYILKTANTYEEMLDSFKLRHEVFYQEFQNISSTGLDTDSFDAYFDHLVIIHKETNKIIGTYRLNCSTFSTVSYTELEFNLQNIRDLGKIYLELGRACVHKDFRNGASVISLLWRGIIEYMNLSGAQILFGCSSVKINNPQEAALLYQYLIVKGSVFINSLSHPTKNFEMPYFDIWNSYYELGLSESQSKNAERLIPSLLRSYLHLGAKIASIPAFDRDFDCIDMLTVLKREEISNSLARRFQLVQ